MKKVLLGMSGGVDSSACAIILKEQGFDVTGVTIKMCPDSYSAFSDANFPKDVNDAKNVANALNIKHMVLDFSEIFLQNVINNFINEYYAGRTPNPCVICNKYLKFGALLNYANNHDFDYIATGHYANVIFNPKINRWLLKKADSTKDQSYVLYTLTQEQLSHIIFPLSKMDKTEARELLKKYNFEINNKPESQDICFIKNNAYINFLNEYSHKTASSGNFIDASGNVLGTHSGIVNYTIGQRKGLGISLGKPMYVTKIDAISNSITLGEEGSQYSSGLVASNLNFIPFDSLDHEITVFAKIRYQALPEKATLIPYSDTQVKVLFFSPQRSVTPGQTVVFYDENNFVIGGGIIEKSF